MKLAPSMGVLKRGSCVQVYYSPMLKNFGDIANEDLYRFLTSRIPVTPNEAVAYDDLPRDDWWYASAAEVGRLKESPCYCSIGSIISFVKPVSGHHPRPVYWGCGVLDEKQKLKTRPLKVLAVRGPNSVRYLRANGVLDTPKVFGDPGILFPGLYADVITDAQPKYPIGLIPHFMDKRRLDAAKLPSWVKLISVAGRDAKHVIHDMLDCGVIVSSSLHGIIAADALGIPSVHMIVGDKVVGGTVTDRFKFDDYELSIGSPRTPVLWTFDTGWTRTLAEDLIAKATVLDSSPLVRPLLDVCPFADDGRADALASAYDAAKLRLKTRVLPGIPY